MARKLVHTESTCFGFNGPFVDGNDNVYIMQYSNTGGPEVMKAGTDPLVDTWTASTGGPTQVNQTSANWLEGDDIHMCQQQSGTVYYSNYRVSTHGTPDSWETVAETVENPANNPITEGCFIAVRSDGDIIVLYQGDTDKEMGTDYDRVDYARKEGTWTVGTQVSASALLDYLALGIGRGKADKMYFHWAGDTGVDAFKTLTSGNSLSLSIALDLDVAANASPYLGYYDDGGVDVMTFGAVISASAADSQQSRDEVVQTELSLSGTDFDASAPCIAMDGTDAYMVYRSGTADDVLYQKSSDGGAWGNITTVSTATTPTRISASVIDHGGGKVLAVVYLDSTDVYYDEISIADAAPFLPYYPRAIIKTPLIQT